MSLISKNRDKIPDSLTVQKSNSILIWRHNSLFQ